MFNDIPRPSIATSYHVMLILVFIRYMLFSKNTFFICLPHKYLEEHIPHIPLS